MCETSLSQSKNNKKQDKQEENVLLLLVTAAAAVGDPHSLHCKVVTSDTSHVETTPLLQSAPVGHDCAADRYANSRLCVQTSSSTSPNNRVLACSSLPAAAVPHPVFFLLIFLYLRVMF